MSLLVGVGVVAMVVFVAARAWPIFEHNGLSWLLGGGDFETEIDQDDRRRRRNPPAAVYHLRAWPLIYGTLLTSAIAVVLGLRDRGALVDLHRRARARARAPGGRSR